MKRLVIRWEKVYYQQSYPPSLKPCGEFEQFILRDFLCPVFLEVSLVHDSGAALVHNLIVVRLAAEHMIVCQDV